MTEAHYRIVGEALLWTLERGLGPDSANARKVSRDIDEDVRDHVRGLAPK